MSQVGQHLDLIKIIPSLIQNDLLVKEMTSKDSEALNLLTGCYLNALNSKAELEIE